MMTVSAMVNDMLVICFDLYIYTRMFSMQKDDLRHRAAMYGGCGAIIVLYYIVSGVFGVPEAFASAVCMTVPSFLLFLWLSRYRDSRFVLTFCFVDTISLIIAFIGRYVGMTFRHGQVSSVFVTGILFFILVIVGNPYFKRYHRLLEVAKAGWRSMAVATVLIYFCLIFFTAYPKPMLERIEYAPSWLAFAAVVISCYVVFILSILKTRKIYEQNKRLEMEKYIYHMAFTDVLTGLYNRTFYEQRVKDIENQQDKPAGLCCVVLDINNFKNVNDTKGHYAGDQLLIVVAQKLRETFEAYTKDVFRVGGDEFCMFLEDVEENLVKDKLLLLQHGLPDGISVAAGYAFVEPENNDTVSQAYIRADKMMYRTKSEMKKSL